VAQNELAGLLAAQDRVWVWAALPALLMAPWDGTIRPSTES